MPEIKNKFNILPALAVLAALLMAADMWVILAWAPEERLMGLIQKIFYLHMPLAWWALFSFFLVFVCGLLYLFKRRMVWDVLAEAAAEVGLLLAGLALISGSIWARVSWGSWWLWDPRLSTTLIMWFIYAGYLLLRKLDFPPQRRALLSAVLGVVAFIDVPLVFFSTRLWPQTVHPEVVKRGGLGPEMLFALLFSLAAVGVLWAAVLIWRFRLGKLEERLERIRMDMILGDS